MAASAEPSTLDSPYRGQKLDSGEIRLLAISWTEDELELHTTCHELSDDVGFDAISYVWGTAPASRTVMCNGAPLSITPSALEMLRYLYFYKPDPERPIWIDAICINQRDAEEKAVQVPQMHQIYSRASTVIVWMGSSTFETTVFIKGIQSISGSWIYEPAASEIDERLPALDNPFWTGLSQLLSTDWFRRLWTFQEVVLARSAVLLRGDQWLDLIQFLEFATYRYYNPGFRLGMLRLIEHSVMEPCDRILSYRSIGPVSAYDLPDLLHRMRRRQVGEEVDRIWALYGLFDETLQRDLAPLVDYSEAARAQPWVTLANCMKSIVQLSQRLDFLEIPRSEQSRPLYSPSWSPDFRGRGNVALRIHGFWNRSLKDYPILWRQVLAEEEAAMTTLRSAAIFRHPKIHISTARRHDHLSIRGFELDTIAEVIEDKRLLAAWDYIEDSKADQGNFSDSNPTHVAAMSWLASGLNLARRTYQRDEGKITDIPWEFLMVLWTDHRVGEVAKTAYQDATKVMMGGNYSEVFSLSVQRSIRARAVMQCFQGIVGHSFFSTAGGRFGLAVPGCKSGDKVCVFYGGRPLYVIRPHEHNVVSATDVKDKLWEFVGTAYIPHLMDQHRNDDARQGPDQIYTLA